MIIFLFHKTATTEIYTLSLHDALPISLCGRGTTLNQVLMYGWHASGVERDAQDFDAYAAFLPRWLKEDRKSTRLNSSHVEISYAVFCLKKKKCLMLSIHIN